MKQMLSSSLALLMLAACASPTAEMDHKYVPTGSNIPRKNGNIARTGDVLSREQMERVLRTSTPINPPHYTQLSSPLRYARMPAAKSMTRCRPVQSALVPGSPSHLRPRKPPKLATSRITALSDRGSFGIGFPATIYAACHSSRSNSTSQSICGQVRPSRASI